LYLTHCLLPTVLAAAPLPAPVLAEALRAAVLTPVLLAPVVAVSRAAVFAAILLAPVVAVPRAAVFAAILLAPVLAEARAAILAAPLPAPVLAEAFRAAVPALLLLAPVRPVRAGTSRRGVFFFAAFFAASLHLLLRYLQLYLVPLRLPLPSVYLPVQPLHVSKGFSLLLHQVCGPVAPSSTTDWA
jgi:hypothetical protein